MINLKTRELIDTEPPPSGTESGWFTKEHPDREVQTPENPGLHKPQEPPDPAPPFQVKLSGVPDYDCIYSRGCAPTAAGNVLGYHDDDYDLLIDGGNKYYTGYRNYDGVTGEGYLHTIWDELGPAMGYVEGWGVVVKPYCMIDDGIRDVCNDPVWENYYNFTVTHLNWSYSPSSQYSTVKGEIRAYRPMVYTLRYPTYGGGAGYHAVTLMGYGCLTPPWGTPLANSSNQSLDKTTDYYEYLYICHDGNSSTGTDVYLWWSEFIEDSHIDKVCPGGGSLLMSKSSSVSLFCRNYPNPFNPATEIRYSISMKSPVVIKIVNTLGQTIYTFNEGVKEPGSYSVRWDGCDDSGVLVAGGIYYYLLQAGNEKKTGKMTLVR